MPGKPPYIPKPGSRPQVASTPYQTINPPFRTSRTILFKETLPGGSISYHLGGFVQTGILVDEAYPEVIQVSATEIDDHVSYEELERFEHADFEEHLANPYDEDDKLELGRIQDLLRGPLKGRRGRTKTRHVHPLRSRRPVLGSLFPESDAATPGTEHNSSSSDGDNKANDVPLLGIYPTSEWRISNL